jgi:hypothetical protein
VSAGVALKLRGEREVPRVQALLDLSHFATNGMYVSVITVLLTGVAATFVAGLMGTWLDLGRARAVGTDVRRDVRARLGLGPRPATSRRSDRMKPKGKQPAELPDAARLATLTMSSRPWRSRRSGMSALVLILWVMVTEPF